MAIIDVSWNDSDKLGEVSLSNGGLSASINGGSDKTFIRANKGKLEGKWYWEIKVDSKSGTLVLDIGISNSISVARGTSNRSYYSYNGYKVSNGASSTYGSTYDSGDIVSVLLDLDSGTLEFWKNGVSQGNAFTDIKTIIGEIFPFLSSPTAQTINKANITANFGGASFVYSVPSGYQPYAFELINKVLISSDEKLYSVASRKYETKMTSNSSPSPYVISASSSYNTTTNAPFRAFDGDGSVNWITANGQKTGWVQIDYGKNIETNYLTISTKGSALHETAFPKKFQILASNDGTTFDIIKEFEYTKWKESDSHMFAFGQKINYRYFRFNILENNGHASYTGIPELTYVLGDNLYLIPNSSDKSFIDYGIDKNTSVSLEGDIVSIVYVSNQSVAMGNGKIFKQKIDPSKHPIKSVSIT